MVCQLLVSPLGQIPWQKQLKERRGSFRSLRHSGKSAAPGAGGGCSTVSTAWTQRKAALLVLSAISFLFWDLSPQVGAAHTQGRPSYLS